MYKSVGVCVSVREMGNLLQLMAFEKMDQVGRGLGIKRCGPLSPSLPTLTSGC